MRNPFRRIKTSLKNGRRVLDRYRPAAGQDDNVSQHTDPLRAYFEERGAFRRRDRLPVMFGDYELDLDARVGSGAFGTVHICEHRVTKRKYAGKLFDIAFVTEPGNIDMVYSEANILKRLSHKNTISFVDLVFSRRGALLVMELVEGTDLHTMVPDCEGMLESFARILFVQLLEVMKYLHSKRIVHRDIKIENVLVDTRGNLKLVDYGLAELISEDVTKKTGLMVSGAYGTRYCYPPEIARAHANDDHNTEFIGDKADIWTAGIFLFCLVSGDSAFKDRSEEELMNEISLANVDYDTVDFSPELEDLLRSILKLDPSDRASIEEMMNHPWSQGKQFDNISRKTDFTNPGGKIQVSFVNAVAKRTLSCPKSFLQLEKTESSTSRKSPSCRELNGWRSESCTDSTSDRSSYEEGLSDNRDNRSEINSCCVSNQDYNSLTSRGKKPRSWGNRRALRSWCAALKSSFLNWNDRLRGRIIQSELTCRDLEQWW